MLFAEILKKVEENKKIFEECIASYGDEYAFTFEQVKAAIFDKYLQNPDACAKIEMIQSMAEDRMERGEPMNDIINMDQISKKNKGEVFTPTKLVDDMLDKLPVEVWSNKNYKWIDIAVGSGVFMWHGVIPRLIKGLANVIPDEKERTMHIASMIYGVDIQITNIGICRPYIIKMLGIETKDIIINHFTLHDSLTFDYWGGVNFDVVVGNPPYQDASTNGTRKGGYGGRSLWDEFVNKSLSILNDGGYLVYVHPSAWRKPEHDMWGVMTSKQILHLDIHSKAEGTKVFGAATRYDWYVMENKPVYTTTSVRDEIGKIHNIDLREWNFLPNYMIDEVKSILGEQEVIYSRSAYGNDKKWMAKEVNKPHPYPVVYSQTMDGNTIWGSEVNNRGHYGVKKVILSMNEKQYPFNDHSGMYAMSTIIFGLPISTKQEGDSIVAAINSDKFKEIIKATKWSTFQTEWRMFKYFRKDFWKDFI